MLAVKLNERPVMLCCGTVPVQAFDGIAFFALSAFLCFPSSHMNTLIDFFLVTFPPAGPAGSCSLRRLRLPFVFLLFQARATVHRFLGGPGCRCSKARQDCRVVWGSCGAFNGTLQVRSGTGTTASCASLYLIYRDPSFKSSLIAPVLSSCSTAKRRPQRPSSYYVASTVTVLRQVCSCWLQSFLLSPSSATCD